jgi:hypothetical protein
VCVYIWLCVCVCVCHDRHLIFGSRAHPDEELQPLFLLRPQKDKWCDQKRLLSSSKDQWYLWYTYWSQPALDLELKEWLVASRPPSWRQRGDRGFFLCSVAVAIHSYSLWFLQCSSYVWTAGGGCPTGPPIRTMSGIFGSCFPWPDIPGTAWTPPDSVLEVRRSTPHT